MFLFSHFWCVCAVDASLRNFIRYLTMFLCSRGKISAVTLSLSPFLWNMCWVSVWNSTSWNRYMDKGNREREREERVVFYNLLVCVFIWLLTKHTLLCQKIQKQLVKHHGKRHFYYWCTNATLPPHTCIFHTENKLGTFSILTSSSTLVKTNSFMNLYKLFCCFRHLYDHNMPMRVVNLFCRAGFISHAHV